MKNLTWSLLFLLAAFAPSKLVKTKVSDGITVSIPEQLIPMSPEDIAQRFPSVRAPLGAYTNQDRDVDFSVNISATSWPDGNVEVAKDFFKASLVNMYDKIDMIDEGIRELHKKKYIYFIFESRITGERKQGLTDPVLKYTHIMYLVQPKRTLVFTFSCPQDVREDWEEGSKEMMMSVRVK